PERRAGPVVAPGVVQRHVGLQLARPGQEVGFIDPVFDDPSELGVARTPAPSLPHMGKSNSWPPPCPPRERGREIKCPHPEPSPASGGGRIYTSGAITRRGCPQAPRPRTGGSRHGRHSSAGGEARRCCPC